MRSRPKVVGVRVNDHEEAAIKAAADLLSRTEGDYLRLVALRVAEQLGVTVAKQTERKPETSGQLQAA